MILVIFILYFLQIALVFVGDQDERLLDGEGLALKMSFQVVLSLQSVTFQHSSF